MNFDWQTWIALGIVALAAWYIVRLAFGRSSDEGGCGGCSGCGKQEQSSGTGSRKLYKIE